MSSPIVSTDGSTFTLSFPLELVGAIAEQAANLLAERDRGFLDVDGACAYLGGCSRKRIYHLVEREQIPHHRAAGRLLFDRRELRNWVEAQR